MTSFDEVIDLALISISDYKLAKLYELSEEAFKKYCDGFLIGAVPNFTQCRTALTYDIENREFDNVLSPTEVGILADFWAIQWFTKEVQNSAQFQLKIQNSGSFHNFSEAQNLKEKTSWLDRLRERVNQKITDYQLEDISNIGY